jgi:prepilin-type processing-associated H-X9-DG protein
VVSGPESAYRTIQTLKSKYVPQVLETQRLGIMNVRIQAGETGQWTRKEGVKRGKANPHTADQELLHLTGNGYQNKIDPRSPLILPGMHSSYGMNGQIEPKRFASKQFMLMDAKKTTLNILEEGDHGELDEIPDVVAPRHLGKANVAFVDGSVSSLSVNELVEEKDRPDHGRWDYIPRH